MHKDVVFALASTALIGFWAVLCPMPRFETVKAKSFGTDSLASLGFRHFSELGTGKDVVTFTTDDTLLVGRVVVSRSLSSTPTAGGLAGWLGWLRNTGASTG